MSSTSSKSSQPFLEALYEEFVTPEIFGFPIKTLGVIRVAVERRGIIVEFSKNQKRFYAADSIDQSELGKTSTLSFPPTVKINPSLEQFVTTVRTTVSIKLKNGHRVVIPSRQAEKLKRAVDSIRGY